MYVQTGKTFITTLIAVVLALGGQDHPAVAVFHRDSGPIDDRAAQIELADSVVSEGGIQVDAIREQTERDELVAGGADQDVFAFPHRAEVRVVGKGADPEPVGAVVGDACHARSRRSRDRQTEDEPLRV